METRRFFFCRKTQENSDWNFHNGQAYSCPRDWRHSASWGHNWGPPWNPLRIMALYVPGDYWGGLNWASIMLKRESLSDSRTNLRYLDPIPVMIKAWAINAEKFLFLFLFLFPFHFPLREIPGFLFHSTENYRNDNFFFAYEPNRI